MNYVGIDPGLTGGIAFLRENDELDLRLIPKIGDELDLKALFEIIKEFNGKDVVYGLEDVHSIFGASAGSNFKFGRVLGVKEMALIANGCTYTMVQPKQWQKIIWAGVPVQTKKDGSKDTKAISLLAARRWFPGEDFTPKGKRTPQDGLVDAALIAKYLKLTFK